MAGKARVITLTEEERQQLESWTHKGTTEQCLVPRARIVLEAAAGKMTKEIALKLGLRPATVSKWRTRFFQQGIAGLPDVARRGGRPKYSMETEQRILAQLDNTPPAGHSSWTGKLLAAALGDVSDDQVWRVLSRHSIHLQRRRSWCISTGPRICS